MRDLQKNLREALFTQGYILTVLHGNSRETATREKNPLQGLEHQRWSREGIGKACPMLFPIFSRLLLSCATCTPGLHQHRRQVIMVQAITYRRHRLRPRISRPRKTRCSRPQKPQFLYMESNERQQIVPNCACACISPVCASFAHGLLCLRTSELKTELFKLVGSRGQITSLVAYISQVVGPPL